jgi:hypothetical protein
MIATMIGGMVQYRGSSYRGSTAVRGRRSQPIAHQGVESMKEVGVAEGESTAAA